MADLFGLMSGRSGLLHSVLVQVATVAWNGATLALATGGRVEAATGCRFSLVSRCMCRLRVSTPLLIVTVEDKPGPGARCSVCVLR